MNDRFRCRGCITITYTDTEKDEDKEVKIIIEPEALYCNDDQSIGISYERLEKAIDSLKLEEKEKDYIWNALYDMELDYHWYNFSPDYVEQCTGLKDKNGKLIYEGDIVEVSEAYENGIYKIEFCQSDCEYHLYNKEGNFIHQLTKSMARYMKVIGNIHENKELLDE